MVFVYIFHDCGYLTERDSDKNNLYKPNLLPDNMIFLNFLS